LPPGIPESIGLAMRRRIALLDPTVVPLAEDSAVFIENGGANRDSAFF
jgi:hypothetical protein